MAGLCREGGFWAARETHATTGLHLPSSPPPSPSPGDKGESFYVVERGRFDIIVNGTKVAEFGEGTPNMSFGEVRGARRGAALR
jgi:hypothetical protein